MKRLALAVASAAAGLLLACFAPTEPVRGTDPLFTGTWYTLDFTLAGNVDSLFTRAAGGQLAGEWREYLSGALYASAVVSGTYDTAGAFTARLRYSTGETRSLVGSAHGADYVDVIWTDSTKGLWRDYVFYRGPPPPCSSPLVVRGKYIPPLPPSYFVGFPNGDDAAAEARRLAQRYGIAADQVFTSAPKGLNARLTTAQLMVIQCEPSVDSIAYIIGY